MEFSSQRDWKKHIEDYICDLSLLDAEPSCSNRRSNAKEGRGPSSTETVTRAGRSQFLGVLGIDLPHDLVPLLIEL